MKFSSIVKAGLIGLGALLIAGAAQAADPPSIADFMGSTPAGDWSKAMWNMIFGEWFDKPFSLGATGGSLLSKVIVIFNTGIFAIGMMWLSYGVGSAMVGTANDGKALGERINTAWYPIRSVVGVAGLIPAFQGFTGSQAVMVWIGGFSIGLANTIWAGAINSNTPLLDIDIIKPAIEQKYRDLARSMVMSSVCLVGKDQAEKEALAQGIDTGRPSTLVNGVQPVESAPTWGSAKAVAYKYGISEKLDYCGSVLLTQSGGGRSGSWTFGFRTNTVDYSAIRERAFNGNLAAMRQMKDQALALAQRYAQDYESQSNNPGAPAASIKPADVDALAETYKSTVQSYVTGDSASGSQVSSATKKQMADAGWLSAGAYFSTFAEANSAVSDSAKSVEVQYMAPTPYAGTRESNLLVNAMNSFSKEKATSPAPDVMNDGDLPLGESIVRMGVDGFTAGSGGNGTPIGKSGIKLINPIIMFKNMGDYVMGTASTILAVSAAATVSDGVLKLGSETLKKVPLVGDSLAGATTGFVSKLLGPIGSFLGAMGWLLMIVGGLMSLYLPLVPFIQWMGAVMGYAASFIEGVLAMPLHSLSHLDADGEGMGQRTTQGYLFMLNTLARAPLMVISFFVSSGLVVAIGSIAAALFLPAMVSMQGNSVTGLASIIGLLLIFFIINVMLINGAFELIHVIPDQVIGYVGGGNVNTHLGRDAEGKINGLWVAAISGGRNAMREAGAAARESRTKGNAPKPPPPKP